MSTSEPRVAPAATGSAPVDRAPVLLDRSGLDALIGALIADGYRVFGPTPRGSAIGFEQITSADDLPWGLGVDVGPGEYRVRPRTDGAAFGHSAGPRSPKSILHPARELVWSADAEDDFMPRPPADPDPRPCAFFGIRPCDLRAIEILEGVLTGGRHPDANHARREVDRFVLVAECTEPAETCFCASAGAGPGVGVAGGYDLKLVELTAAPGDPDRPGEGDRPREPRFVVTAATERGASMLDRVPHRPAPTSDIARADDEVSAAADAMGRSLPAVDLRRLLVDARESPRWDEIAERCLTCGNCTLVCPTCFCTTTEDLTDLTGDHTMRWRRWDSCFDLEFTRMHTGSVRESGRSRYRQWITHKLSTWHDQFGTSGCVGCGRCIAWCPVGIDITEEATAFATAAADGDSGGSW